MIEFAGNKYKIETWAGQHLGHTVACDTETEVVPFTQTPRLVTFQAYSSGDTAYYVERCDVKHFLELHADSRLIFHNFAFDADVISFHLDDKRCWDDKLERELVFDTQIMYKLLHLAGMGYVPHRSSLAHVVKSYFEIDLEKGDELRLTWGEYLGKNLSDIPFSMREYGAIDVIATRKIYQHMRRCMSAIRHPSNIPYSFLSHHIQIKGAIALNHIYKNGINFNSDKAAKMLAEVNEKLDTLAKRLMMWGWVRKRRGANEVYEKACEALGIADILPKTEDGSISSKEEDLKKYRHIQFIDDYLNFHTLEKESTFFRDLLGKEKVHPRYNLLVNTGRTSCSKPNFQQLPRSGEVRSLFHAATGKTLVITDYSAIELATLAQVCYSRYGESVMREKINAGQDLHRYYASVLYNCDPADITKDQRQKAKAANFGFPGGLGIATFIEFSRGYGLNLTEDDARSMKEVWFEAFPEVERYLRDDNGGDAWTLTGRLRSDATYCAERNTPFQGLAADGAKLALYNLDRSGYRVVGFCHDEIITEVDLDKAESYRKDQERIMIESMNEVVPDIKISVESQISKVYCK